MDNRLKQKLTNGEGVFGLIAPNSDPILAETVGLLGFDYFMIDGEHGPITVNEVENFCRACEIRNISPLARIRSNDPKLILQYLDAGIMGVMMPGISCVQDVEKLVSAIKYPPLGDRGLGPVRSASYMMGSENQKEYVVRMNESTLVLPMFEDIKALDELEQMVQVEGIDGFIIGPRDLAMSMGHIDGPAGHEDVASVIGEAKKIIKKAGLVVGTVAPNGEVAHKLVNEGTFFVIGSLSGLLAKSAKEFLEQAKIK